MTITGYLVALFFATVLSLGSLIAIIFRITPAGDNLPVFILFYLTLFLSAVGIFSIFGYFIRKRFQKDKPTFYILAVSFRQGIFLALLLVGSLILQKQGWLVWWSGLILIFIAIFVEGIFLSRRGLNR